MLSILFTPQFVNSYPLRRNGHYLADGSFICIFLNEDNKISIQISPKFVPRSPTDNKSALFQALAWCPTGYKPLP